MPIHGTGRARILTDITSDTDNKARKHCFRAIIMCYITLPIIISVMSSNFSLLFISSLFHDASVRVAVALLKTNTSLL